VRSINVPQCLSCKTGRSTQPGLQEQKRGGVICKSSQVTVLKDFTSDCDVIQLDNLEYDTVWHHAWGHYLLFLPFKDSWFLYVPPGLALNSSPFCPQVHYCDFWARSQSWEKRLLALSCLSVLPRRTNRVPLDGFSWSYMLRPFSKICREYSDFGKIGRKYQALYMKA
jgi:hypothetical protein